MSRSRSHDRLVFSPARFQALLDVHRGKVRFDNGLLGGPAGYRWDAEGGTCPDERTLSELWRADLIDVGTTALFAFAGHEVVLTRAGREVLYEWGATRARHVA